MATHGPSFRFAAPRTKDTTQNTGFGSRLPMRNNSNATSTNSSSLTSSEKASTSKTATSRSPAKLRRKNPSRLPKSEDGYADAKHDLRIQTSGDRNVQQMNEPMSAPAAIPAPPPIATSTETSSRSARYPWPPRTPESVTCLVTPTPSLTQGWFSLPADGAPSHPLRRKRSVIGTYISGKRDLEQSGNGSVVVPSAGQYNGQQDPQTGKTHPNLLASPFIGSPSRPTTASTDPHVFNHTPTLISEPSTTPSLRHTESSSAFSRANSTTPTSQTSYSPMISNSPHFGPGAWNNSPRKTTRDVRIAGLQSPRLAQLPSANNLGSDSSPFQVREPGNLIPELAHLAHDTNHMERPQNRRPVRPSREGTPTLAPCETFLPVIYSDLEPGKVNHHRRKSSFNASSSGSKSETADSHSIISSPSKSSQALALSKSLQDAYVTQPSKANPVNSSHSLMSPSISDPGKPSSRFGFLSRKDKSKSSSLPEASVKPLKKGPMAGTGHEGYGKYAPAGRSNTTAGLNSGSVKSTSKSGLARPTKTGLQSSSTKSSASTDNFVTSKLTPVYMRASNGSDGEDTYPDGIVRSDSNSSLADDEATAIRSTISSTQTSSGSYSSSKPSKSGMRTSGIPQSTSTSISSQATSSRSCESWTNGQVALDTRISKENYRKDANSDSEPSDMTTSKSQRLMDKELTSLGPEQPKNRKSNWPMFSKSPQKSKSGLKWNPFQKSQHSSIEEESKDLGPVQTGTRDIAQPRAIAHYEMIDETGAQDEHFDLNDLKDLMDEVDAVQSEYQSDTDDMRPGLAVSAPASRGKSVGYNESAQILTSHLKLSPELYGERVQQGSEEDIPVSERVEEQVQGRNTTQNRPSRLAQVGRIPKVVSTREATWKPSPVRSFSRLFGPVQPEPILTNFDRSSLRTGSTASLASQSLRGDNSSATLSRTSTQNNDQAAGTGQNHQRNLSPEFFSLKHNSDYSYSSSSGTFYFPSAALTAVVPSVGSPASEDEVWQEYDDLIDKVLTPVVSRDSGASKKKASAKKSHVSEEGEIETLERDQTSRNDSEFPKISDMASTLRPDLSPFVGTQRRSEIFSGFELPEISPAFSSSCSEEDVTITLANSVPVLKDADRSSQRPRDADEIESGQSISPGDAQETDGANFMKLTPKSMANLRFGALMTSKWLSFGRVLFSPAHYELIDSPEDRVLVIDGLGTDWSYFTALTYPNLTVYSFGSGPSPTSDRQKPGPWQPLANHRHYCHDDITSNFPFPKNFFAVVVYRFPAATSEVKMRMSLSECKRVLQPGGYLEASSIDLDLTNMGNKARRAIRALKTQMQEIVPDVCLKPASDNIQYLLGRRGFENLSRCVLGVPAAGVIGDSRTSSRDEREMSFTKLIEDQTQAGDDVMTKMVAKVGRWWYLKTYEMCALPDGDVSSSIWNDTALLRECEKNSATFRLFICYAQKPTMAKRRTVSL